MKVLPMSRSLYTTLLLAASLPGLAAATQLPPDQSPQPSQPQAPNQNFAATRRLMQQGKSDEALSQLQQLPAQDPKLPGLSHEIGAAYYKMGNYLKAAECFKQATEENATDSEAVQLLGLSNYLAGRPIAAIPYLEKVQAWYPFANVDASYILGICYIQTKDYLRARTAFARMFDVPADSAAAYLFTARMLLRQEFDASPKTTG
jgi:tetratricopeptide (TPR) repeat protein